MSARAIDEATGKCLLAEHLKDAPMAPCRVAQVHQDTNWDEILDQHPWLATEMLVAKVDQLVKRRGKLGLVSTGKDLQATRAWVQEHMGKPFRVGRAEGVLRRFILEPFVPHKQEEEMYLSMFSERQSDAVLFLASGGGVGVGDVDRLAMRVDVPVGTDRLSSDAIERKLLKDVVDVDKRKVLSSFIQKLYKAFTELYFTFVEVNPLVVAGDQVHMLDLAAKLDATAEYVCGGLWGRVLFPSPFGRDALPEEKYIEELDAKTGASLKLTVLNPSGRIWTMVAGGGASVIYADTIVELGGAEQLANYGEYSGAPSEQQTYEYAKIILSLMTRHILPDGKILIIGGGIANFTNVAKTFQGIVTALQEFQSKLVEHKVSIFVRRGGPNYQEGLRKMRDLGLGLGIPFHVFGPETHMTAIVSMALGKMPIPERSPIDFSTANFLLPGGQTKDCQRKPEPMCKKGEKGEPCPTRAAESPCSDISGEGAENSGENPAERNPHRPGSLFSQNTRAIVWGMQTRAVQNMMDFDFVCCRSEPSVAAIVYPFGGNHKQKFYWGHKEILIPVYAKMDEAMMKHSDVDVLVNFASLRSAYDTTMETMKYPQIRVIAIIAEGVPENLTRRLIVEAGRSGVVVVGPATVGGLRPGAFKIGNTAGMMDNILNAKLYRPGSVGYVSRSGGLSNELNNVVSKASNGVREGIAIGGDRYPVTTFLDHLLRYQADPDIKILLLLGEVGGMEEYRVCEALKESCITKPLVAWCIGTCAKMFSSDVQFGHAGALASSNAETATAKNAALAAAGARVPSSFEGLPDALRAVYEDLVHKGDIVPEPEVPPPAVPMDYAWARELGLIRKPSSFITSITDERGQELVYAGMPISDVLKQDLGIGGVVSLLWFQRLLPSYVCRFFEMCLMLTADHGPAVSGAHNTIVCARAGKDLISSLVSGLLTIGDRFGGALDEAARQYSEAFDAGLAPAQFVSSMRQKGNLIMGIGHRIKSVNNPDMRVQIVKEYVREHFPAAPLLLFALEVEKITTAKKPNLILNVDGVIAASFVDMLRSSGCFTREEAQEYIEMGSINSLFVLGRSIGFIGHYMDQKRLKQGLYRHPWDDISYILPDQFHSC